MDATLSAQPGLGRCWGPFLPRLPLPALLPEVLRRQHLVVVKEFAPGAGAMQGRQDVLHHTARWGVHLPLEQVDAGPSGHVGALKQQPHLTLWSSWEQGPLLNQPNSKSLL